MFQKFNQKIKAFTLIESLVSIAIVLIAVLAPLTLTLNSIISISQNKNRMIAAYLSEEVVEDLRSFRDSFRLACSDLNLTYDNNGIPTGGFCNRNNANLAIESSMLKNSLNQASFSNQAIAWKLFSKSLSDSNILNQVSYLDKNSFNYTTFSVTTCAQSALSLSPNNGYICNTSNLGPFSRTVEINPSVSGNFLKIEITVVYAKSTIWGLADKSLKVIDYIYER